MQQDPMVAVKLWEWCLAKGQGYHSKSQTHSRSGECQGRLGVKMQTGHQQLEDGFQRISTNLQPVGTAASGFICSETQCTATLVLQLQARLRSSGLHSGLGRSDSVCLPAFSNGRELALIAGRCPAILGE